MSLFSMIINNNNWNRLVVLSSTISFLLIAYALLIISDHPAKGYEISIYTYTPIIYWAAVIIGLVNGIFIIVLALFKKIEKIWILGLFQIIFFNILVIFLYALRGYILYLGRGDVSSYVGMAKDVSDNGHFLTDNFYPLVSILIAQIRQLANISILGISRYLSSFFFVIYILSIYCLARSIYNNKNFIFGTVITSTPILFPWFSTSIYHMLLSVLMIPMLFYCIQRSSDTRFRLISIILVVVFPFFHPLTTIFILLYLLSVYIYKIFIEKVKTTISLFLIGSVSFMTWILSQYFILHNIGLVFSQIFGFSEKVSSAGQIQYYVQKLGLFETIKPFLFMDAHIIILYVISFVAVFYIIKDFDRKFMPIATCFIIGSLFIAFIFLTSRSHNPDRLINLNPNMIFTPILGGYLVYRRLDIAHMLALLIIFSSIMSMFSLYKSPYTLQPNDQMTNNDVVSAKWLLQYKSPNIKVFDILSPLIRYSDMIFGKDFRSNRNELFRPIKNLPNHFGFTDNDTFSIDIDKDKYLIITEYDIQAYTEVWKNVRFDQEDFAKLDSSKNINKIYDSKEVNFYFINKLS